jgi:thiosulfate reductase cytochrome b subunit
MTFGGWPEVSQHWHNEEGLAGALQWHFAAMWLLFVNLLVYLVYGQTSGHFRRTMLPIQPQEICATCGPHSAVNSSTEWANAMPCKGPSISRSSRLLY